MTIPTIVDTHWLNTMPMVHELQGMHDQGMEDWLAYGQMPAPADYLEAVEKPPAPTEHKSLLVRFAAWILGPAP